MRYAIDRQHFKRRIAVLAPTLERILTHDHRMFVKINVLKIVTLASDGVNSLAYGHYRVTCDVSVN